MIRFQIRQWAAWAAGLETRAHWLEWLAAPFALDSSGVPPLAEMPAMMRRRIDPMGRAALQAAYWAQGAMPTGPVVFASRWGEIARSVTMLQELARGEALSPTAFSLSVHNASSALYSIARQDRANYLAVAGGEFSAEAGFVEALGLLADGAPQVLVVCVDGPLPEPYATQADASCQLPLHAWACLLERAEASGGLSLRATSGSDAGARGALPADLAALQFLTGRASELRRDGWLWTRHA